MDESGHDHRQMPYEVRGGVGIHASQLWPFVQAIQTLEVSSFGTRLAEFRKELKGCKLLDKDRFEWASRAVPMPDEERRRFCRSLFTKGLEKKPPVRNELTAYGQACLEMARGIFRLLDQHKAKLFACAIPRGVKRPKSSVAEEFLRKDHVFLLERFFYFLEQHQEHGLMVMDEADKTEDRRFVSRLHRYFEKTQTGRSRTQWIVPTPLFVASDMTYPIQAADLCIYCVNWGFRVPSMKMDAPVRSEIAAEFGPLLGRLQFSGEGYRDGNVYPAYGIVFVPDPYTAR